MAAGSGARAGPRAGYAWVFRGCALAARGSIATACRRRLLSGYGDLESFACTSEWIICNPSGDNGSRRRLNSDLVVHRRGNPLGATEVAFCGLNRDVAKKELNLLQFAAGGAAEPSATTTEIVRREFVNADLGGELLDDVPDELFRYCFAPSSAGATYPPEELPRVNSGGLCPVVQQAMHPIRDGNGSNVTSLSAQVHDCPMPLALL